MQDLLKSLLAELHSQYFKQNGFKKLRNRFCRELEGVVQEVEVQSSQWNIKGEAITFYVNISVRFKDIPKINDVQEWHGSARIEWLAPGMPAQYDLSPTNYSNVRDELISCLPKAFEALPLHYEDVRQRALRGLMTPIPLPDSWRVR